MRVDNCCGTDRRKSGEGMGNKDNTDAYLGRSQVALNLRKTLLEEKEGMERKMLRVIYRRRN
jgi:hypothetical protein